MADSKYSKFWSAALHAVGKDIIRFHAVYWRALLMAVDLPVPKWLVDERCTKNIQIDRESYRPC